VQETQVEIAAVHQEVLLRHPRPEGLQIEGRERVHEKDLSSDQKLEKANPDTVAEHIVRLGIEGYLIHPIERLEERSELAGLVNQTVPGWARRSLGAEQAAVEFDESVERTFTYAAWADRFEGSVHHPPGRMVALAMKEAVGTVGILAPDEAPLLSLLSLVLPAIAMGNTVVAVPSERAATLMGELYQVFDTSDLPGGVVNLVAGRASELGKTLAEHDDVDAIWSFRDEAAAAMVKAASIGNLKQVFSNDGRAIDWFDPAQAEGRWFLRHATQVKNIWVPYGE